MTTSRNDPKDNSTTFMLSPKKGIKSIGSYYIGSNSRNRLELPPSRIMVPLGGVVIAIIALAGVESVHEKIALNQYQDIGQANVFNLDSLSNFGLYGLDLVNESGDLFALGVHRLDSLLLLSAENNIKQTSLVSQTVFSDVMGVAEYYFDYAYAWWKAFKSAALEYIASILDKWKDFIYGVPSYSALDEATLREQIRLELLNELGQGDAQDNNNNDIETPYITQEPVGENKGIIVLPSSTSTVDLVSIQDKIRRMFSDPVDVTFDEATQTGLITPRFRNDRGGEYVFLLAPLN